MDLDRLNEMGFEKTPKWHSVVLIVAFNKWWNIFIAIQCCITFILCTYLFAYKKSFSNLIIYRYFSDVCYLFELVCTITYRVNRKIKRMKYVPIRSWICIFIDIVSLIPFDLLFYFHNFYEDFHTLVKALLIQNRSLRLYRLFLLEYYYETVARSFYEYVCLSIFQYTLRILVSGHLLACFWVLVDKSVDCDSLIYYCPIWYEMNIIDVVLLNWSGREMSFRKPWERVIVSMGMLIGFFIVFSYFYPKIFYFSMLLFYKRALYYEKLGKLQLFFRNMVFDSKLKIQILDRFNDVWSKEQLDPNLPSLITNVPLGLRKEIFADIYWESLRHSELFREVSRNCKRSLALMMTTEYHHSGEMVHLTGQNKVKMLFLTQGILQIMAEENEEFPVMSFSSGTVFGEISLFYLLQSRATLKCKGYCELQILTIRAASSVLKDYPKDKKLVFRCLNERLALAKFTQWRKKKFEEEQKLEELSLENHSTEDCVKWLKKQWKAVWESHKRHLEVIKAKEEGLRLSSWQPILKTKLKVEFISNYLDLIVLSDLLEEKKDVFCLRTTFPWSFDPSTQFFRIWYYVVLITSFIPALLYPVFTAWTKHFPLWMYHVSYIVTIIFMIDVFFKLFTAVNTKHTIITQFPVVLRHLLQTPTFYLDVIAAFPYQLIILFTLDERTAASYDVGLILHPALLKSYVLLNLKVPLWDIMDKITVFKNSMIFILMLFWLAEVVQLVGVRDVTSINASWVDRYMEAKDEDEYMKMYYLSWFNALVHAISIPEYLMYSNNTDIMVYTSLAKYFFFLLLALLVSEFYGISTVKIYRTETFNVMLSRISKFFESIYISDRLIERFLRVIRFQWDYDKADYLSGNMNTIKSIPFAFRKQVYLESTFKTLQACPLFQEESFDFIIDMLEISHLVAVPRGSVLVTYGHTSQFLNILHRGYAQLNSYLTKDVSAEIGHAVQIGPSVMFPLLSAFCSVPCPVSVITITDCEVLMIQLDDMLHIMFKYNFFKDLSDALSEFDLEKRLLDTKPGFLKISPSKPKADREDVRKAFEQMGNCWKCLYFICPKKNLFKNIFFLYWDFVYALFLIVKCWMWPCCFGLFVLQSHIIVPILSALKCVSITHVIFRFCLPYFNSKGVLVTHPVFTCKRYLLGSFALDLFRVFPIYQIHLYGFADPRKKPHIAAVMVVLIQLFFDLRHILEYLRNLEHVVKSNYLIRMLKMTVGLMLSFNWFLNLMMFLNTKWIYGRPYQVVEVEIMNESFMESVQLIDRNSVWDLYILTAYWMLCCLTTNDFLLHNVLSQQLYLSYVLSFIGTFGCFFLYVWVASSSIFADTRSTIYRENVFSLNSYLKYEKTNDELIEYTNSYYNYEWSQTHGESLNVLCEHLPAHLYEELVYPIYKPTFSRNKIFANADEGFFKVLATQVKSVFFNRGSIIMFKKEVQSNIYFVHKGKCFVFDWFLVLDNGSIVGDIHQTGLMRNEVYALTHVEMLKIESDIFFSILNSFYNIEANFLYGVKNMENFIQSDVFRKGQRLRPVDSKDVLKAFRLKQKTTKSEDESVFEDPKNSSIHVLRRLKFTTKTKSSFWIIYPVSWKKKAYTAFSVTVTLATLISLPVFACFGGLTGIAFAVIGVTDFLWLMVILLTFGVGIIDKQKGDVITDFRFIAKNYAMRINGLVIDVLCLIPFEVIPLAIGRNIKEVDGNHVTLARLPRFLRGHYFYRFLRREAESLDNNIYLKEFYVIYIFMVFLFITTCIYFNIATEPSIVAARDHHKLESEQFFAFFMAFEYVINFVSSTNLPVIVPTTRGQLHFFNLHSVLYIYLKSILIRKILSLLYVDGVATAYFKSQIMDLESFLREKDTSPCLIKEVLTYRTNLLLLCRSENMPVMLKNAPATIRILVMRNIYIQHLTNCVLFEGLEKVFLDQLIGRAFREFYFPGQKIAEQGDVDRRMYFIHSGEVYIVGQTKDRAYVEFVVRILKAGESFGEPQGLWFALPHSHTYRARTLVEMLVLHSDDWVDLRRSFPEVVEKLFKKAKALRYI